MAPAHHDFVLQALEGQEERIQRLEDGHTETVAALRAGEKQFQMISDQISTLGKQVTESIQDLGKTVDGLAKTTAEHHEYLRNLNEEKSQRDRRKALVVAAGKWVGAGVILAVMGAWGQDAWTWLKTLAGK